MVCVNDRGLAVSVSGVKATLDDWVLEFESGRLVAVEMGVADGVDMVSFTVERTDAVDGD